MAVGETASTYASSEWASTNRGAIGDVSSLSSSSVVAAAAAATAAAALQLVWGVWLGIVQAATGGDSMDDRQFPGSRPSSSSSSSSTVDLIRSSDGRRVKELVLGCLRCWNGDVAGGRGPGRALPLGPSIVDGDCSTHVASRCATSAPSVGRGQKRRVKQETTTGDNECSSDVDDTISSSARISQSTQQRCDDFLPSLSRSVTSHWKNKFY